MVSPCHAGSTAGENKRVPASPEQSGLVTPFPSPLPGATSAPPKQRPWPMINTLLLVSFESCPSLLPGWGMQQGCCEAVVAFPAWYTGLGSSSLMAGAGTAESVSSSCWCTEQDFEALFLNLEQRGSPGYGQPAPPVSLPSSPD